MALDGSSCRLHAVFDLPADIENHSTIGPIASTSTSNPGSSPSIDSTHVGRQEELDSPELPLRPLTSLRWPYVPDESAYPDPLKRDDPKTLQLRHYEAIGTTFIPIIPTCTKCAFLCSPATSPAIRTILSSNPQLPDLLKSLDTLRGAEREEALQRALGVSAADLDPNAQARGAAGRPPEDDVKALRALAEAIEAAVRGGKEDALGLDWEG
ncbi:hypothetical protein EIP86_000987 [Pleurotus ostreatoroseus]|nr:hypothetical protein EIP86_000987 [Pleurotus ostreatoroseus]